MAGVCRTNLTEPEHAYLQHMLHGQIVDNPQFVALNCKSSHVMLLHNFSVTPSTQLHWNCVNDTWPMCVFESKGPHRLAYQTGGVINSKHFPIALEKQHCSAHLASLFLFFKAVVCWFASAVSLVVHITAGCPWHMQLSTTPNCPLIIKYCLRIAVI